MLSDSPLDLSTITGNSGQPNLSPVAPALMGSPWVHSPDPIPALSSPALTQEWIQPTAQSLESGRFSLESQPADNRWENWGSVSFNANVVALDDSLNSAASLTVAAIPTTVTGFVGWSDPNDYYRFTLGATQDFGLSLTGLTNAADVALLNSAGTTIASSTLSGRSPEAIQSQLTEGTYYIRIYHRSSRFRGTNYVLTVQASSLASPPPPADNAGNTLATARSISLSSTPTSLNDYLGWEDPDDYYQFSLSNTSHFNLSLSGLAADADVQLLDSTGTPLPTGQVRGTSTENISQQLNTGTYYIRVYSYGGHSFYTLGVSATAVVSPPPPSLPSPSVDPTANYSSTSGYGLINAAAAVASTLGQAPFADVPSFGEANDWGANLINAPEVWDKNYTGQGIIVAVLDTGVDRNHPDLNDNIWVNSGDIPGNGRDDDGNGYVDDVYGWNFADNHSNTLDDNGHGTHVAGIIAGERNDFGVTGIAYGAKIMPVKVLSDSGSGSFSNIALGIRYAVDNGAKVLDLSLGGSSGSSELRSAVEYASAKGAIVVMAAGNFRGSQPVYPADYATSWGLAVGAVDPSNTMASFSNQAGSNSAMVFVNAPGVGIYSTQPNNSYTTLNGTSMATPHVAAVVALMLSAQGSLTDAQVRQILMQTSGNALRASSLISSSTETGSPALQSLESVAATDPESSACWGLSNPTGPAAKNPLEPVELPCSPAWMTEMAGSTAAQADPLFSIDSEADPLTLWPRRYLDSQTAELLAPKLLAYG